MFQPPVEQAEYSAGNKIGTQVTHYNEAGDDDQEAEAIVLVDGISGGVGLFKYGYPAIDGGNKPEK
jgi:hypothetical protein